MPYPQWQFGVKPNTLANLVLAGLKTATSSAKRLYCQEKTPYPCVNERQVILDKQNQPVVTIQLTQVAFAQFGEITTAFALAEGEGSLAQWRAEHQRFFAAELNEAIDDSLELVCEYFQVVEIFPQSYAQWLNFAEQALLENAEQDPYLNAKMDANLLLQAVTRRSKSAIFAFSETLLSEAELTSLAGLLARRSRGEPMAYILGEKEFWSLPLKVSTATLIPRPDTERLVEVALEWANKRLKNQEKMQILDLGTGTGAIALALASELGEKATIFGVEREAEALATAESNRQRLGLRGVRFMLSDWFSQLESGQKFDLIVSNPPYIDAQDEHLTQGDVRFEPLSALVAGENGLADLQKIIENAPRYLHRKGALMLEHGWQQAVAVRTIFQQHHWSNIETVQDYGGQDRVTQAIWTR